MSQTIEQMAARAMPAIDELQQRYGSDIEISFRMHPKGRELLFRAGVSIAAKKHGWTVEQQEQLASLESLGTGFMFFGIRGDLNSYTPHDSVEFLPHVPDGTPVLVKVFDFEDDKVEAA